jgi:hypothetical protein
VANIVEEITKAIAAALPGATVRVETGSAGH